MTNDEYLEFLDFLFTKYVRPRIPHVRHRFHHHLEDEWNYHLDQVQRAAQVLRYIDSYCIDDKDVYRTFTEEKLLSTVADARYSLEFSNRAAKEAGFIDIFEEYSREILAGLHPNHLPGVDKEVLTQMGSLNPDVEIRILVQRAKTWRASSDQVLRSGTVSHQLRSVVEQLEKDHKVLQEASKEIGQAETNVQPKKSRRWFKGLGQLCQGTALTVANIALAIGVIQFPVTPETQTWGAVASASTGIATILNGIGDLRNE